ncbi:MAG: hypothetical protein WBW94_10405 [Anaerolineales bacterium]
MKLKDILQISIASLILMAYGWYLGQLHQSGYDIAGILLFITGAAGLVLAFVIYYFTKKYSWHNKWLANFLTGVVSCGIIFVLIVLLTRLYG